MRNFFFFGFHFCAAIEIWGCSAPVGSLILGVWGCERVSSLHFIYSSSPDVLIVPR